MFARSVTERGAIPAQLPALFHVCGRLAVGPLYDILLYYDSLIRWSHTVSNMNSVLDVERVARILVYSHSRAVFVQGLKSIVQMQVLCPAKIRGESDQPSSLAFNSSLT